ncbi:DJ-1/PfpI family protein, partial [Pseudoalteromonas phenolica]
KKAGDVIATAIHDFEGHQTYTEKPGHNFTLNADFSAASADDYDGLYLPGGRAPEYLRLDENVIGLIKAFADTNKPIASICHGPQLLSAANIITGKRISAYPACKPEIILAGAEYVSVEMDQAVTDGNLVTAPAWPAHPEFLKQFIALLNKA